MIVEWLVYALVVSGLVSVAAWLAERGGRAQRWPTRWIWAGAMGTSVAIPFIGWLSPAPEAAAPFAAAAGAYVLETLPALGAGAEVSAGPGFSTLVVAVWLVASALLLSLVTLLSLRLRVRGRSWPRRVVDGVEVLVSRSVGPAALGVVRGRVVVPEWALALAPAQRRLLVLHEAEHVRARDPLLAMAGLLLCVLAPWNVLLWWQLRRLRLALEMDCDARVLRRSPDPRSYGALLLAVGHRKTNLALTLALTESTTMLERRIRMITKTTKGRATLRALALAGVSGLVLAVACETPAPTDTAAPTPMAPAEASESAVAGELSAAPTFTPMTAAPQLRNAESVRSALAEEYPPLLKKAGVGGVANVWFFIDADGQVEKTQLNSSSGHEALDHAALRVAATMEFAPARNGDERVPVWVALDVRFEADPVEVVRGRIDQFGEEEPAASEREAHRAPPAAPTQATQLSAGPTFTPMTVAPRLRNQQEISRRLESLYPPLLRDAGIGGTANVWLFIDETGRVMKTQVNQSSGHEALDEAALAVAREMEFQPAMNREERAAVWVALDITFEVQ